VLLSANYPWAWVVSQFREIGLGLLLGLGLWLTYLNPHPLLALKHNRSTHHPDKSPTANVRTHNRLNSNCIPSPKKIVIAHKHHTPPALDLDHLQVVVCVCVCVCVCVRVGLSICFVSLHIGISVHTKKAPKRVHITANKYFSLLRASSAHLPAHSILPRVPILYNGKENPCMRACVTPWFRHRLGLGLLGGGETVDCWCFTVKIGASKPVHTHTRNTRKHYHYLIRQLQVSH